MNKKFTVGEVSKIVNMPIRTLHYYDEIGIFKPAEVDSITNYRYYNESQIANMDLIKSLKYIGTSLANIKKAQQMTPKELLHFLSEQEEALQLKMKRMRDIQDVLLKTKKQLQEQISIPKFHEIYFTTEDAQRVLSLKVEDATLIDVPSTYFSELTYTIEQGGSVLSNRYGATFPLKKYERGDQFVYTHLYTSLLTEHMIGQLSEKMTVKKMEGGNYICIAFPFTIDTYVENYQKLYNFIINHHLNVVSEVYELFLPTKFSPNEEPDYVVELKVRINP